VNVPATAATRTVAGFHLLPFRAPRRRRGIQLFIGLYLFGVGMALAIEADYGADPWTVFHQGVADRTGATIGTITVLTGVAILGLLRVLHEPLGVGTISNALVIGPAIDITLWMIPTLEAAAPRIVFLALSPVTVGLASGLYLGAGCGPGPRDGLMTALGRRGLRTWVARTVVELSALTIGWVLGGTAGLGTAWTALAVGPFVHVFLERIPPIDDP
jgi:uncharacterized membrane protein YczE